MWKNGDATGGDQLGVMIFLLVGVWLGYIAQSYFTLVAWSFYKEQNGGL